MKTYTVALIGAGGTGSELLSHLLRLHLALEALGYAKLDVTVYDHDTVSQSNLVRQRFAAPDIGHNKAVTLIRRINMTANVGWKAVPEALSIRNFPTYTDFLISCVDSRATRRVIHEQIQLHWTKHRERYWIDCGNGYRTGQVLIGKTGEWHWPMPTEVHPELMDTSLPEDGPSCSAMEALSAQDLFVNSRVALETADMLWRMFRHKEAITEVYFNLETHSTAAQRLTIAAPETQAASSA